MEIRTFFGRGEYGESMAGGSLGNASRVAPGGHVSIPCLVLVDKMFVWFIWACPFLRCPVYVGLGCST